MTLILQGTDNSVSSPAVQGGTAGTTTGVYYPASNQIALATNGTQAMLVNASQQIGIGITPTVRLQVLGAASGATCIFGVGANGNGGIVWRNASDASVGYTQVNSDNVEYRTTNDSTGVYMQKPGITFPATQFASSDANTLDDYEEGTFSPTITGDTGPSSITYSSQVGRYIKIGNVVNVWLYIQVNTISGGSGASFITNLPFTCGSGVQGGIYNNWSSTGTTSLFATAGHIPVSQARAYLVYVSGGTTQQLPLSQIVSATQLIMCGSYTLQS